jgi:hypothetical protein
LEAKASARPRIQEKIHQRDQRGNQQNKNGDADFHRNQMPIERYQGIGCDHHRHGGQPHAQPIGSGSCDSQQWTQRQILCQHDIVVPQTVLGYFSIRGREKNG